MPKGRQAKGSIRVTTSVDVTVADKLEAFARTNKVSKSWVVARAIETYLAAPLNRDTVPPSNPRRKHGT